MIGEKEKEKIGKKSLSDKQFTKSIFTIIGITFVLMTVLILLSVKNIFYK